MFRASFNKACKWVISDEYVGHRLIGGAFIGAIVGLRWSMNETKKWENWTVGERAIVISGATTSGTLIGGAFGAVAVVSLPVGVASCIAAKMTQPESASKRK